MQLVVKHVSEPQKLARSDCECAGMPSGKGHCGLMHAPCATPESTYVMRALPHGALRATSLAALGGWLVKR